jgi:hypothetical protein
VTIAVAVVSQLLAAHFPAPLHELKKLRRDNGACTRPSGRCSGNTTGVRDGSAACCDRYARSIAADRYLEALPSRHLVWRELHQLMSPRPPGSDPAMKSRLFIDNDRESIGIGRFVAVPKPDRKRTGNAQSCYLAGDMA